MKPADYRQGCVVQQDTPYKVEKSDQSTHSSEGVLRIGRVVWIQRKPEEPMDQATITAYAEGVGLVSLDPKLLKLLKMSW